MRTMSSKTKINRLTFLIFIGIIGLFSNSCDEDVSINRPTTTPLPNHIQDRSWLTGDPCSPPCWYGLHLDESTEQDVLEVIETLPFIDSDEVSISNSGFTNLMTEEYFLSTDIRAPKIGHSFIRLRIGEGVLFHIKFSLNYTISIGEVVDEIGAPDELRINPDYNTEYCDVELYWLPQQLIVTTRLNDDDWEEKCGEIGNNNPLERDLTVDYVELIHRDWLTATFNGDDGYNWPGFSD